MLNNNPSRRRLLHALLGGLFGWHFAEKTQAAGSPLPIATVETPIPAESIASTFSYECWEGSIDNTITYSWSGGETRLRS